MRKIPSTTTVRWLLIFFFCSNARGAPPKLDAEWTVKPDFSAVTLSVTNRDTRAIKVWPILDLYRKIIDPRLGFGHGFWSDVTDSEHAILPMVRFLDRAGQPVEIMALPVNMPVPAPREIAVGATGKIQLIVGVGADFKDAAGKAKIIVLSLESQSKEVCRVTLRKRFGRWVQDSSNATR